ncbi:MAG TPA: hypothetical protein VM010_08520 [Chitinophagaceae bacterium]|nr:hypothetical protein [Chitinophagaceae bacterium]
MLYNLPTKIGVLCCVFLYTTAVAQNDSDSLFESESVLDLKLSGSTRKLFNDRSDNAAYHPLRLSYKNADSSETRIEVAAKTRGNFRRKSANCTYPPILLNFQNATIANTLFKNQKKVKLVVPCRGDKYVVREYLVYKLYNLITPKSYRARLVKTTFSDSAKKEAVTFLSFLLEEDEQLARRNGLKLQNKKMVQGEVTEKETFLEMAVFQYMIGNTDWSVPYLHNIRILAFDSLTIPYVVPYDFDHAGIVDAPYALPPEELTLSSTHERRFRGYCITDLKAFEQTVATFNRLKKDIYNVYTSCSLLDAKYVAATVKYLDRFYETLNNPKQLKAEFTYPCNMANPAIVIQGLGNK